MKRSNITTLSLPWNQIGSTLPNLAQCIRLSLQKLRLEYKDKEEMSAIWKELGSKIGRRGSLQIGGLFEIGCGANPSTRIDAAKHPAEVAKLKELYAVPASMTQEAMLNGWAEEQIVPNLTLAVTGISSPIEPSQAEVKAMVDEVPDTKQRYQISAADFKVEMPACFRFSHRRRQEKAIEHKLDFVRDQALAEMRDYRKTLGKGEDVSISIQTQADNQASVTASFFSQDQNKLQIPETAEGLAFQAKLDAARKAPNKYLQTCLADGKAHASLTPFATLKEARRRTVRERMKSYRGLSRNMQLYPNGELIRISAKEWGLASRDLDCSREVIDDALDCIQAHLEQHTKALHLSEIVPVIEDWGLKCKDSNLSYPIFSFCQTDTRFKSWQGGLIGLSRWGKPNRHTVTSAVKTILTPNLNSITLEQFHSQLEDKVGRRVEKSLLSGILSNSELVYDSKLRIWVRQTPDDLED